MIEQSVKLNRAGAARVWYFLRLGGSKPTAEIWKSLRPLQRRWLWRYVHGVAHADLYGPECFTPRGLR